MDIWALNLRHLRAVAETARRGSVNAAAQAISLTQPALTQGISKLEAQFGLALFDRSPAGMSPTEASRMLTPRIDAALGHVASTRVTMSQIRAFLALADAGSYPGASKATGLAQPSLHRAIADLSVALRRTLVERRGRGVALTEAGRRTARAFRLAQAELLAGLSEIETIKGHESGCVAVGAMPLCRARLLPAAVADFHRHHPEIAIRIIEGSHAELIEPLRDGAIDLMIGALRDGAQGDDLVAQALFDDRPVIIGRNGHPLRGAPTDPARLATFPWTISAPGTPLRLLWEHLFADAGCTPPPVPVECGSVITIRQILMNSDFLTLLSPDQVAVELEAGWLTKICDAPAGLARTIGITTRANWTPTRLQRAFLETVIAFGAVP